MNEYTKPVYYSETDVDGYIRLDAVFDELSNIINYHSESIGKGAKYLLDIGRTWFVIGWHIRIYDHAKLLENITMKTWGHDLSAAFCSRNVTMKSGDKALVDADSLWAVYDMKRGMLTKIKDVDTEGYDYCDGLDMEGVDRKMSVNCTTLIGDVTFGRYDIDYNEHVNNMAYLKKAITYIENERAISDIKVVYCKQTKFGETLNLYMDEVEPSVYEMKMTGESEADVRVVMRIEAKERL